MSYTKEGSLFLKVFFIKEVPKRMTQEKLKKKNFYVPCQMVSSAASPLLLLHCFTISEKSLLPVVLKMAQDCLPLPGTSSGYDSPGCWTHVVAHSSANDPCIAWP